MAEYISYQETGYFSKIVTDYLSLQEESLGQNNSLQNFYQHSYNVQGIKDTISSRKKFNTNRKLLVDQLELQYVDVVTSDKVKNNISALKDENTFTICTAHQPNIFTGHLYFIYKIVHVIKLADTLNRELPENKFVPVFYVGSEDADLEELAEVSINGEKYTWNTNQTGAVGRMLVDDELLKILKKISGQLAVEPFGKQIIELMQECYLKGRSIQDACFSLVNKLFSDYGLVVLLPDNAALKKSMTAVFEEDIFQNIPSEIVNKTVVQLAQHYKVQAQPREINLFYLHDNIRNRIVLQKDIYIIQGTDTKFTKEELKNELLQHPERFSPNVILRSLYQETILPNVAFIGGGGELAYWLELKDMFQHYNIPYPVLVLRNSFLLINEKANVLIQKLSLSSLDIFKADNDLLKAIVIKNTSHQLSFENEKHNIVSVYEKIKISVNEIDVTLAKHVESLEAKILKTIGKLEIKLLRSEKRKFESQQRQIGRMKSNLFPDNELQERIENFMPYYGKWGKGFINLIYDNSLNFEQQFCIIKKLNDN
ncbi:MAG: bacillithiol biosynthesis cysteine-adding enzyme BshC [Chitinophagaceae bacterium]|nr:bacillithiol biosynthesis cysteine-adding enzyme BshC [Chitinophagaceae bacterium]